MWGFGATLGADAANAAVGEVRVGCPICQQMGDVSANADEQEWWRH